MVDEARLLKVRLKIVLCVYFTASFLYCVLGNVMTGDSKMGLVCVYLMRDITLSVEPSVTITVLCAK